MFLLSPTDTLGVAYDDAEALLELAEVNLLASRRADFGQLAVAHAWALLHRRRDNAPRGAGADRSWRELGAYRLPVYEYAAAELGVSLRVHTLAAQRLMGDAVDLHERLPRAWAAVEHLELEVWVARRIAHLTRELDDEAAQRVDEQVAPVLATLPTGRLLTLVEARVVAADQAAADARAEQARSRRTLVMGRDIEAGTRTLFARVDAADALRFHSTASAIADVLAAQQEDAEERPASHEELMARAVGILAQPDLAAQLLTGEEDPHRPVSRPRTVLYVHTTPAHLDGDEDGTRGTRVARAEELGAMTRRQLISLLGHEHVTVRPVIDLTDQVAADCYEVPASMAERLHLTRPYDVFPYAPSLSRAMDQDHTQPYVHGSPAPPGQTRIDNLGKMSRRHHRTKTHAPGWTLHQRDGMYWWTTPHGRTLSVDFDGTHRHPALPPPRPPDSKAEVELAT